MFKLLKMEDNQKLSNANFSKNAIFYKDMLAFYEAYSLIQERKDNLPNFCTLPNGELCLEGVCFLMKMYATEFKFETLKLSLNYLKILYYTIASYTDGEEVDKNVIISEFDSLRNASLDYCKEKKYELDNARKKLSNNEKIISSSSKKQRGLEQGSKLSKILSILLLIVSTAGVLGVTMLAINFSASSMWFVSALILDVVGFGLTIGLFVSARHKKNSSSDLAVHIQNLKKGIKTEKELFFDLQTKYYRIFCEKNEYDGCFAEIISKYTKVISIDEILAKAKEYKLLSYNFAYDIGRLFKSQQREIDELIFEIDSINASKNIEVEFENIYQKILEQDWLYYNAEVRYYFLKKFCDLSEKEFSWKITIKGKKVNPFDLNIKSLTREKIAFSPENGTKLIASNLADFSKTNYYKQFEDLGFANGYSVDEFKRVKSSYLERFYNAEIFEDMSGVFFTKKDSKKILNKNFDAERGQKIPTLINLKLKLIENTMGLGNSDAKVIKSMSKSVLGEESFDENNVENIKEEDIDYPRFTAKTTENIGNAVVYNVGEKKIVGYKVDVE